MPVEGYEHKHLWLWRSKFRYPWPLAPMLDPDWDGDWQGGVVEGLRRGRATMHSLQIHDLIHAYGSETHGGWEVAEEHAKDADRSGSPWLNDQAIARRLPERVLRKKAWAEFSEEERQRVAAAKARLAEQAAARLDAKRRAAELKAENKRRQAEQDAEWAQREEELKAKRRAEQDAEWLRVGAERNEAEQRRFDQLQADARRRLQERELIYKNKWQCVACKGLAITVELQGAGYNLKCRSCGAHAWGKHATVARMAMLAA